MPDVARTVKIGQLVRYGRPASPSEQYFGNVLNYYFLTRHGAGDELALPALQLERGINSPAPTHAIDMTRRSVINLSSSPDKAGSAVTPWHDEFDLDHGHVRYYGDHRVDILDPVGSTPGNKALLETWELHASGRPDERLLAPPVLLYVKPRHVDDIRMSKGYRIFAGAAIIERLEYVVQRDPTTRQTYPNLVLDLNVISLNENDELDFRWIDDRRDPRLRLDETLRYAPASWRQWVRQGRAALPGVRRRVLSSRVLSRAEQMPDPGTPDADLLDRIYHAFDDNKHAFEWLAARVAEHVLGAGYSDGWLTKSGGDGGMDFVGRLNVGNTAAKTPLVVLGQAKCIMPTSSISPDQVARLVARLRRGWVGVFVTTGSYTTQAQVEVVDDEYPVVLVTGRVLAETVRRLAEESYEGDADKLLATALEEYPAAVTHRRPSEILSTAG